MLPPDAYSISVECELDKKRRNMNAKMKRAQKKERPPTTPQAFGTQRTGVDLLASLIDDLLDRAVDLFGIPVALVLCIVKQNGCLVPGLGKTVRGQRRSQYKTTTMRRPYDYYSARLEWQTSQTWWLAQQGLRGSDTCPLDRRRGCSFCRPLGRI
jgi:hypothetical protein